MIVEDTFYNVRCDVCGEDVNDTWWNNANDAQASAEDCDYKLLGGKHYCHNCYHYDELNGRDIIVTKDGRKFWDENGEEIKEN